MESKDSKASDQKNNKEGHEKHKKDIEFIKTSIKEVKDIDNENFEFKRLCGNSNAVYMVTIKDKRAEPGKIIFRTFGKTDLVVDKEKEHKVFTSMSKAGKGPKCYGANEKARLEEYFESSAIENTDVNKPLWRRRLALTIAAHHSEDIEVHKQNVIAQRLNDEKFWKEFERKANSDKLNEEEKKKVAEIKKVCTKEELKYVEGLIPSEHQVFSHNDTLCGNILVSKDNNRVILIDYEYSGYNNRAFDGANLFVESLMNYEVEEPPCYKWSRDVFPSKDDVRDFAKYYLYAHKNHKQIDQLREDDSKMNDDSWLDKEVANDKDFQESIDQYLDEFQRGVILSTYYWLTWGVVMYKSAAEKSENKDDDESGFDNLSFAHDKLAYYHAWKDAYEKNHDIFKADLPKQ